MIRESADLLKHVLYVKSKIKLYIKSIQKSKNASFNPSFLLIPLRVASTHFDVSLFHIIFVLEEQATLRAHFWWGGTP